MPYKILAAMTKDLLEEQVNEHMKADWQLQGGVAVSASDEHYKNILYAQAVIKKRKIDKAV